MTVLKFLSGNSCKIQFSGHIPNGLNPSGKQKSAIDNLKMATMSTDFVVVFKLETKYSFISIETKKNKIGNFRKILSWDKYTLGEGKRKRMTHCYWMGKAHVLWPQ